MKEVIAFYKQVNRHYIWLHIIYVIILVCTMLFWFIVPLFIVCYGRLDMTSLKDFIVFIGLFIFPAAVGSAHCWIISYQAAKEWVKKKSNVQYWLWVLIFQGLAFFISLSLTVSMYLLFIIIDLIR